MFRAKDTQQRVLRTKITLDLILYLSKLLKSEPAWVSVPWRGWQS